MNIRVPTGRHVPLLTLKINYMFPVTSARVNPILVDNLKDVTGKDTTEVISDALELLAEKYILNSRKRFEDIASSVLHAFQALEIKADQGPLSREDSLFYSFYTKVIELYERVEKKLE